MVGTIQEPNTVVRTRTSMAMARRPIPTMFGNTTEIVDVVLNEVRARQTNGRMSVVLLSHVNDRHPSENSSRIAYIDSSNMRFVRGEPARLDTTESRIIRIDFLSQR